MMRELLRAAVAGFCQSCREHRAALLFLALACIAHYLQLHP